MPFARSDAGVEPLILTFCLPALWLHRDAAAIRTSHAPVSSSTIADIPSALDGFAMSLWQHIGAFWILGHLVWAAILVEKAWRRNRNLTGEPRIAETNS